MVVVIDYGIGNTGSVLNMLKRIGAQAIRSCHPTDLKAAKKLILPGVGAFDQGMKQLEDAGIIPLLRKLVLDCKVPILGICLGMHLLAQESEEGTRPGLGWLAAHVKRFSFNGTLSHYKVPHIGWNEIRVTSSHPLFRNLEEKARFYFVHSYHIVDASDSVLAYAHYGYDIVAAMAKDNIMGVQFHPEKSHKFGFQLLRNFLGIA